MMNWILLVMAAVVAVVGALVLGGLVSPRARLASREVRLRASLDAVWPLLCMVEQTPAWCPDLPNMTLLEEAPPQLRRLRLLDDAGDAIGEWTLVSSVRDGGTQLSVAEVVVLRNPVQRFVRSFGSGTARVDGFLRALATQVGEPDVAIGGITMHPSGEQARAQREATASDSSVQ
ncbi:MAG: hypothetical protein ACK6DP_20100 [Gemmatimonas sp.]|uniref:hypothetical protein n=1 Tax=Gemmatimonas sp. TaxID=1962908 RepID=UPI00391F47F0